MVVGIVVDFGLRGLAACGVRAGHPLRPAVEGVHGLLLVMAAQQVGLYRLGHTALDVVVISRVKPGRGAGHRHLAAGQVSFRAHRSRGEIAVVEARLAAEVIRVVVVLDPDGLGALVLAVAFALFGQAVQGVILVVRPAVGGALHAVLRESHPVRRVVLVHHRVHARRLPFDAALAIVVCVAERVLGQIPAVLVGGLEHVEQVSVVIVQVIGVEGVVAVHHPFQYDLPELVREGIAHVPVLVRDAGHFQRAGGADASRDKRAAG